VTHELTDTSEIYEVPNPEDGLWKVTATGLEVAAGGEPIDFEVGQTQPEPEPPLALFEASAAKGPPPLLIHFDASGSTDPTDQALTYAWNFGDGSTGTGVKPSHTYASEGEYVTKLTVTDEDGETDTFESLPIIVEPVKAEPPADSSGGGGSGPGVASGASGPVSVPTPLARPKSAKCRQRFHRKKVHGKYRCVKAKKHKKKGRKRGPGRSGSYRLP
jgi:PKD repeat protein